MEFVLVYGMNECILALFFSSYSTRVKLPSSVFHVNVKSACKSGKLNVKDKDKTESNRVNEVMLLYINTVMMCTTCLFVSLIIKCVYTV